MEILLPGPERGKFVVIYGSNNLGKSEQIRRLTTSLINEGKQVLIIKYPLYALKPTGPRINSILRNPEDPERGLDEAKFQEYYVRNRLDFQPTLISILNAGIHVIAEDYTGTGIAWGMTRGVQLSLLEQMNELLIVPDIALLLDGNRFTTNIEGKHRNEGDLDSIWDANRQAHITLATKYGWEIINANQSVEDVHSAIKSKLDNYFN